MRSRRVLLWVLVAGLTRLPVACAGSGGDSGDADPRLWPAPDPPPALSRAIESIVDPADLGVYVEHADFGAEDPPERRDLGGFGLGNRIVFGLVGLTFPLNTIHNAIGPEYQKEDRFFGDHALWLRDGETGEILPFREEWAMQVRGTAVTITQARAAGAILETIDVAPWTSSIDAPERRAILRIAVVRPSGARDGTGAGDEAGGRRSIEVVARAVMPVRSGPGWIEEANGGRVLRVGFLDAGGDARGGDLVRSLGRLVKGREIVLPMAYVFAGRARAEAEIAETLAAIRSRGPEALIREARESWLAWIAGAAEIDTPDPRVDDLVLGMLVTLEVQRSRFGASSPMSQYTRSWLRDLIGPVRYLLDMGAFDDAKAALDYQYGAILGDGDLKNSVPLDRDPAAAPPAPDWQSLPPLEGKVAAEGPSYQILAYHRLYRHTGDLGLVRDRWGFLRRCLEGQDLGELDLLPFSGDETYRTAMSLGLGMSPVYPFETLAWSANSSFLYVAAAEAMAELADTLGEADRAEGYRVLADRVRGETRRYYLLPEGFYSPFLDRDNLSPERRPFEDVNLAPLWTGYAGWDDPVELRNLDETLARIGREDGTIQTPLPPVYRGLTSLLGIDVHDGIFTGMVPGYLLYDLTVAGHPMADVSFDALGRTVMPTGNWAEYMIHDDFSALSVHDPTGVIGNYTARYRPWEGGIDLDALFAFLVGAEPDAAAGRVRIAPRLPNGWKRLDVRGLRVGGNRYDLAVRERAGSGAGGGERTYRIDNQGPGVLAFDLVVLAGERAVGSIEAGGSRIDLGDLPVRIRYGRTSFTVADLSVAGSASLTVRIEWARE